MTRLARKQPKLGGNMEKTQGGGSALQGSPLTEDWRELWIPHAGGDIQRSPGPFPFYCATSLADS